VIKRPPLPSPNAPLVLPKPPEFLELAPWLREVFESLRPHLHTGADGSWTFNISRVDLPPDEVAGGQAVLALLLRRLQVLYAQASTPSLISQDALVSGLDELQHQLAELDRAQPSFAPPCLLPLDRARDAVSEPEQDNVVFCNTEVTDDQVE
jgi:hypothetical protein